MRFMFKSFCVIQKLYVAGQRFLGVEKKKLLDATIRH